MKRILIAIGLTLAFGASVQAKTPKEVIEPYKAYRVALAEDKKEDAAKYAYEAWQKAEDLMGDSKTTGDLASNFADLRPYYLDNKQAWKLVMKAHKRAIDLAEAHTDRPDEIEIDRRVKYLAWKIPTLDPSLKGFRDKKYTAKRLTERILEFGLTETTFEAESYALQSQAAVMLEDWDSALENAERSIDIFDARTDQIFSVYEFGVPIYMARAYSAQKRPIDAALTYQALMDKLEIRGGHDNAISANAYKDWLDLRDKVKTLDSSDLRALEVINYKVPDSRQSEFSPLVRIPPQFPPKFLQGRYSGWVRVKFSVDEEGRVEDVIATDYSSKVLVDASIESVKAWRYSPNAEQEKRKDIESTIRFDLQGRNGARLPSKKPLPDFE